VFDEPSDQPIDTPSCKITGAEILLFDGVFLCRPELSGYWDVMIFLDGQARVNLARLGHVMTDAPAEQADLVGHVLDWVERLDRYASGMRLYLESDDPVSRADLVIDNNDLAHPAIRAKRSNERP
jgi:uridine kinase